MERTRLRELSPLHPAFFPSFLLRGNGENSFKRIVTWHLQKNYFQFLFCGNGENSFKRIVTLFHFFSFHLFSSVEMERTRLRELSRLSISFLSLFIFVCGNGENSFKRIVTFSYFHILLLFGRWKWRELV